ncbi:peptidoglycan-binding protein, partial [Devosia sp.]|uniref:peptidoglycan-binding protein n=1 Tax=Devosia sp. TaxID=1871048 RepID=UPI001ACF07B2
SHIAGIATLIADGPKVDVEALNRRLDDVTATVSKLAELQKHYADRADVSGMTARLDDVSATVGRLADLQVQFANRVETPRDDGLKASMTSIEDGLRGIYDRIDAVERSMAVPPAEIEKITAELARVAQAIKAPQQPQGLIELIDALNDRISDIEARSNEVGELKLDMEALRNTVVLALEPRFAAIETQIEALSDRVGERPGDPGIAQLEAQVRQLVARMDQTGEQLTGLAKLYAAPGDMPDMGAIADMVAERTSEAMKRTSPATGLDEAGYAEIEKRIAKVVKAAARAEPSEETVALQATIREVADRLQRLETSLEPREAASDPAPVAAAQPEVAAAGPAPATRPAAGIAFIAPVLDDEPLRLATTIDPADSMPAAPGADAPLIARPFPPPTSVTPTLGPVKPARTAGAPSAQPVEGDPKPIFDPSLAERPPQPPSTLDLPDEDVFVATRDIAGSRPTEPAMDESPLPNRNTFIEAHRRAARQATAARPAMLPPVDGNSLIGRAFARFQANRTAAETAPVPVSDAPAGVPDEPRANARAAKAAAALVETDEPAVGKKKPGRFSLLGRAKAARQPAGDEPPTSQWQPEEPAAARVLPVAPEPSAVALGAEDTSPPADHAASRRDSFLLRHKQPILLAASVVALACLTINLINQRMKTAPDAPVAQSKDVSDATLAPVPMAAQGFDASSKPRVVLDTLTTSSIDGGVAQKFVAGTPAPPALAFAAATQVAAAAPVGSASLGDAVQPLPSALESPVKVERPPAAVGPAPLLDAAADGDARAQFEVAAIYTEGRAVPEDLKAAAMWYERAASQGFAPAQYRLGNLYENGRGVEKDMAQARLWYQQAAEAGNRMAMHNLAALYAGGSLGTQQFDAAAKWFEEAANRGMKDSQFNLGMLYARGLGVKQDLSASFKWFSLAANRGDQDAAKARDDVAGSLDAATVQALIAEVAAFRPQPIDFVANFAPIGTWSDTFDPGAPITDTRVVTGVQKALALLGFDIGTPDGVAGDKTAEAIKSFERQTGMSESGRINPRLLAVLGSQPV